MIAAVAVAHALPLYTCNPGWLGASWPETAVNYVRGGPGVDACARPEWSQDTLRDCEVFPEMVPW